MANITISTLREDVLDRLDNLVNSADLSESLRKKLSSPARVTMALNRGLVVFVRDANTAMVSGLVAVAALSADTDIGTAGTVGGVTTYLWPDVALSERLDSGVIEIILDGIERPITAAHIVPLDTLRFMSGSDLYKEQAMAFNIDMVNKRIYAFETVEVKARVIQSPDQITDANTYNAVATIPVSESFLALLSQLSLYELLKAAGSFPNRAEILTSNEPAPEPDAQGE